MTQKIFYSQKDILHTKKDFKQKIFTQEKIFYSGKNYFTHRIVEHYRVGSLDVAGHLVGLGEDHLGHVVGVGTHLELARLKINNSENITDNSTEEFHGSSITCVSRGKLSNLIGQMKLMWVAWRA